MRKKYLAMKTVSKITFEADGKTYNAKLPKGCVGVMYVFKKKKHATKFFGEDVECNTVK